MDYKKNFFIHCSDNILSGTEHLSDKIISKT